MISLLFMAFSALAQPLPFGLTFSVGVPFEQKQFLEQDVMRLGRLNFVDQDGELLRIFKIPTVENSEMQMWLQKRVRYVVNADHAFNSTALTSLEDDVDYPESLDARGIDNSVVMTNVGGMIYRLGKDNKVLIGFDMEGVGIVPVTSPRVGILRIGPSLFQPLSKKMSDEDVGNRLHSLYRLSTLFHEARHSDGHGQHLTFPHAECPAGHDYATVAGCDAAANGAYRIGALFLRSTLEACSDCSALEKETLRLLILDSENRILSPLQDNQIAPAKTAVMNGKLCRQLKTSGVQPAFCKEPSKKETRIEWEDSPESL